MNCRGAKRTALLAIVSLLVPMLAVAQQDAATTRDAQQARREARAEARADARRDARRDANAGVEANQNPDERSKAMQERRRVEGALREALALAVRQRLNLNDQQAARLMDVNRKFGEDRLRLARDEIRIRRELRQSIDGRDSARSPGTARLLDELLDAQRQRLDLQQKEQSALSEFLTPEQRARYIGMMEQLRRRIQLRADSARTAGAPPDA
jgi:hypothetical protein